MCPSSNLQTGAAKSIGLHPISLLARMRFRVTLNTDNRLMSGTSLSREAALLAAEADWTVADLRWVTINAMKSAFLPFDQRLALIDTVIKPGYAAHGLPSLTLFVAICRMTGLVESALVCVHLRWFDGARMEVDAREPWSTLCSGPPSAGAGARRPAPRGSTPTAERPRGFGFPVRVWDQDPDEPDLPVSATISSIDRSDLSFEAVEPPFGTPISPGCCRDVCLHAAAAGDGGPTFIANLLIQWGHTLPVGSDPQPGVLVQVLVEDGAEGAGTAGGVGTGR